jgi:hypothetical protein
MLCLGLIVELGLILFLFDAISATSDPVHPFDEVWVIRNWFLISHLELISEFLS